MVSDVNRVFPAILSCNTISEKPFHANHMRDSDSPSYIAPPYPIKLIWIGVYVKHERLIINNLKNYNTKAMAMFATFVY